MVKKVILGVIVSACFIIFALIIKFIVLKERKEVPGGGVAVKDIKQEGTKKPPKTQPKAEPPKIQEPYKKEPYPFNIDEGYFKMAKLLRKVEVSLDAGNITLDGILNELSTQASVPIDLSERVKSLARQELSLKIETSKLEDALLKLIDSLGESGKDLGILIRVGRIFIADKDEIKESESERAVKVLVLGEEELENKTASEKLLSLLKEKRIDIEVAEATLEETVEHIGKALEVPMTILPGTNYDKTIRFSLVERGTIAEQMLEVVCRHFGVEYYIFDGILVICDRFNHDEFIRKEDEKNRSFETILSSVVKIEEKTDFIKFYKALSENKNAPRIYPSRQLWNRNPSSSLPAGNHSLKEILDSFKPSIRTVPIKTDEFLALTLFLEE
jgi:hypothetical protein